MATLPATQERWLISEPPRDSYNGGDALLCADAVALSDELLRSAG
jgi:hypothetical protein